MSVAAIMMVKDEADILASTLHHLATQVDAIYISDNRSTDGTQELIIGQFGDIVEMTIDDNPAYYQSKKMTAMAFEAWQRGHKWVVPCDADEIWYREGATLREHLLGLAGDVMVVKADLYDHIPTAEDDWETCPDDPVARIGWRKRHKGALPKVACRARPDMTIDAGNHSAHFRGVGLAVEGLTIRHFSWRTPEQYLHKIRNGEAAYAATDLDPSFGAHWRMFAEHEDSTVLAHFNKWFYSHRPYEDETLIFDPAPTGTSLGSPRTAMKGAAT